MTQHDPSTLVVPCRVNVMQYAEDGAKDLMVGRLLADEMRMSALIRRGSSLRVRGDSADFPIRRRKDSDSTSQVTWSSPTADVVCGDLISAVH
jgi:hypothetical protein